MASTPEQNAAAQQRFRDKAKVDGYKMTVVTYPKRDDGKVKKYLAGLRRVFKKEKNNG